MKRWDLIVTVLLFVLGALCFIFFDVRPITILEDPLSNKLLCGFLSRVGVGLFFGWLLYKFGGRYLIVFNRSFVKNLAWSLPCFMVAFVNFPYAALISGEASVISTNAMGFYILYIVSVAFLEELIFRGALLVLLNDFLRNTKHKPLLIALIGAGAFSLYHLTNILMGADVGFTLLQCAYTFLIGGMLMITVMRTKNIWLCILIHAIFDFGGLLIIHLGTGNPWDLVFWILTIVSGLLCAGHIIFSLIKLEKDYVS